MANIIRVTPEELTAAAGRMEASGSTVENMTQQMTAKVLELTGTIWSGEAQKAYMDKFKGLEADIVKLTKMVKEQSTNLRVIAAEYASTEQTNVNGAGKLSSGVII